MSEQMHQATAGGRAQASRRLYEEGWNQGRVEVFDELLAPDFRGHDPQDPFPERRGPMAGRETFEMYRAAFPDVRMTVEDLIEQGDRVVIRWRATGTHQGELMGLAPTRRHVEVTGIAIDRWAGDRIAETWINWDTHGLLQQIGAAPAHGSLGEKVGIRMQRTITRIAQRRRGHAMR
jgi:predicted ester cyclase